MPSTLRLAALMVAVLAIFGLGVWAIVAKSPGMGDGFVGRVALSQVTADVELPDVIGPDDLPLIVIDPGHGGFDPGATAGGYLEKQLVLDLAEALRSEIERQGFARVALTRDSDTYLLHNERYRIAQRLDADLFLSIHADSAGESGEVAGASIYTLSAAASSRAAALFAARENASDVIGGVDLSEQSATVSEILVDLSQRRTQQRSERFADLIEQEARGTIAFHPQARRSAWLAVLRAPDVPSVLFESGFISNEADAARLASEEGQVAFARAVARAARIYFNQVDTR